MKLSLIWAMTRNRVIGVNNRLPWNLPDEMAHFRRVTLGKPVIMGRNTYDSMGRPLPKRLNVVMSRQLKALSGVELASDFGDALRIAHMYAVDNELDEIMVIGGAHIYELALPLADRLYATTIDAEIDGEILFPQYDSEPWKLVDSTHHPVDAQHEYAFTIEVFDKVRQPA